MSFTIDDSMITLATGFSFRDDIPPAVVQREGVSGGLSLLHENGEEEWLSTSLVAYGYLEELDETFLVEYSGFTGLVDALVAAGVVERVETIRFGPFSLAAHRVRIL